MCSMQHLRHLRFLSMLVEKKKIMLLAISFFLSSRHITTLSSYKF